MEAAEQRRSTLRSKRKPLSDCTNILPTPTTRRKNPSSSSKIPKCQTQIKSPNKPINSSANSSVNNKLPNPPPSCSSPKSHTSTGSNISPNSISVPSIPLSPEPPAPPTPLSDAGGIDSKKSGLSAVQNQRHNATRKDKGKMVADAPIIQLSVSTTSNSLKISSAAPDNCTQSGIQSVQSQKLHAQALKDKGKTVVDAPVIESSVPWESKYLHSTSPFTSDDCLSETSAVHSQTLLVETRKDKGKGVIETPNIEASEPSTPHAPLASLAASGPCERPVTIYNVRARQGRKHAIGKTNAPMTCPPDQRKKKKGLELDYDRDNNNSGPHTDPLPMHKKKRSCNKNDDESLQKEVETLRAQYAEVDAFKLIEESASEDDLD